MKEGRKQEYPEKTPGDELQKMPHTTARRFNPQARLEPAQLYWWQTRKADMLTVTPRVDPQQWQCTSYLYQNNRSQVQLETLTTVKEKDIPKLVTQTRTSLA